MTTTLRLCLISAIIFGFAVFEVNLQRYRDIYGRRYSTNKRAQSRSGDPTIVEPYPSGDETKVAEEAGVPPPPLSSSNYNTNSNNKDQVISIAVSKENDDSNSKSDYDEDYDSGGGVGGGGGGNSDGVTDESIGANGCICVPYYQCADGKIVTDGSGLIDPRKITPPKQEIPLESSYKPPFCGTFHVCCSDPETVSTQKPYVHNCGVRNPSGINKRALSPVGVGESDFGEWPWQAALLKYENGANLFQCGGVLIDELHVLTVAHCVERFANDKRNKLVIRLGEWDTQNTNEFLPHEDFTATTIHIHPSFRNSSLWNDIALIKLDREVDWKPNIESICLPKPDEYFDGQKCVTTGWGKNAFKGGMYSNILKEVSLYLVSYHSCQSALRTTRLGQRYRLHDSLICAGGESGVDACKGDGGGPLVCYRKDGTYALAGLVSWGIDCGKPGIPGVYVKVNKFLDWISEHTTLDISEYYSQSINKYKG